MNQYPIKLSITLSLAISFFGLLGRLGPGARINIIHLVGAELVVFLLSLSCCLAIFYVLRTSPTLRWWLDPLAAAFCCGCLSVFIFVCSHFFFEEVADKAIFEKSLPKGLWTLFFRGIMTASIIYPVAWFFEALRKEQEEKLALEQLKLENLLARLNYLQQQMNPDLLLSSLHVLTLNSHDEWTREYVAQFTGIYHYLVSLNHESYLVRLRDELRFTEGYIHILRQRFEDSLEISIRLSAGGKDRYIPPLALQTVVENAIKHNALSSSSPLRIRIFDNGDLLIVENDLRLKSIGSSGSPGIGLHNLKERYRIIGGLSPQIFHGKKVFAVSLPLLHDKAVDFKKY